MSSISKNGLPAARISGLATGALMLAAALGAAGRGAEATGEAASRENDTGTIRGTVRAADGAGLPEMIVYLESAEPGRKFDPPAECPVVAQKGARFKPALLAVCVGQKVAFANDEDGPIEHNVYSKSAAKPFDLGLYARNVTKVVVFDKPGAVQLHCSIHKSMDGVVFVSPTPYFAQPGPDGKFELRDVAPGEYKLRTWQHHARFVEAEMPVTVEKGRTDAVAVELALP